MAPYSVERLHDLGDRRALLPDRAVDADQVLTLAVDDGVEADGSLAGLAVADDQLTLAAANRNHGVDRLEACHHRLAHRLTIDYAGCQPLDGQTLRGGNGALIVNGLAERIYDAADERFTHGDAENLPGTLDLVAFANLGVLAHQHGADLVFFEVHGESRDAVGELDEFAGHNLVETMQAGDAVTQRDNRAHLVDADLRVVICNLLLQELRYFICVYLSHASLF